MVVFKYIQIDTPLKFLVHVVVHKSMLQIKNKLQINKFKATFMDGWRCFTEAFGHVILPADSVKFPFPPVSAKSRKLQSDMNGDKNIIAENDVDPRLKESTQGRDLEGSPLPEAGLHTHWRRCVCSSLDGRAIGSFARPGLAHIAGQQEALLAPFVPAGAQAGSRRVIVARAHIGSGNHGATLWGKLMPGHVAGCRVSVQQAWRDHAVGKTTRDKSGVS